jgi:hypothetical protein
VKKKGPSRVHLAVEGLPDSFLIDGKRRALLLYFERVVVGLQPGPGASSQALKHGPRYHAADSLGTGAEIKRPQPTYQLPSSFSKDLSLFQELLHLFDLRLGKLLRQFGQELSHEGTLRLFTPGDADILA